MTSSIRALVVGVLLIAATLPVDLPLPQPVAVRAAEPAHPAEHPSLGYTQELEHSREKVSFAAGGRVTVPFVPRATDENLVGGKRPRALPAGRLSGAELRDGTTRTAPGTGTMSTQSLATPEATIAEPPPGGLRRAVYGFLPYWKLSDTTFDYSTLSTIAYFGVGASATGHLVKYDADGRLTSHWSGWTSSRLTTVINDAHAAGVRVVLTIERFSWTTADRDATVALLSDPARRSTLVAEIAQAVRDRGVDGVNLDFEPVPSTQKANFVAFTREMRAALDAQAPGYELVIDSTGSIGSYDVAGLVAPGAADAIFIMGYAYGGPGTQYAASNAPLNGPYYNYLSTFDAYLRYTTPDKLIMGVPYYGETSSTVDDSLNSLRQTDSATYGGQTSPSYASTETLGMKHPVRWDPYSLSPWIAYRYQHCTACPATWRQSYYEDTRSLGLKYDLINRVGLRGAGIWALGGEGASTAPAGLLRAKFIDDTTPPAVSVSPLPPETGSEAVTVSWSAVDDWNAVVAYDTQVAEDEGPWTDWLTGATGTSATYLGRDGHAYTFRVRGRDAVGNVGQWVDAPRWRPTVALSPGSYARITHTTLAYRQKPTTTATSLLTLRQGDVVEIRSGPVIAGTYEWYQVDAVVKGTPTDPIESRIGGWIAARNGTNRYAEPIAALASTVVTGTTIRGLALTTPDAAPPSTPTGVGASAPPAISPDGNGRGDLLRISYSLASPLASVELRLYRVEDRTLAATAPLSGTSVGAHAFDWDGRNATGNVVPEGRYLVQLAGSDSGGWHYAPTEDMNDPGLPLASVSVVVDTTAPVGAFAAGGLPSATSSETLDVAWTEEDAGSGVATRLVEQERTAVPESGACLDASGWATSAAFDAVSPWTVTGLDGEACVRFAITLTDRAGNAATAHSDAVLLDTNAPASPTLAVTGVALGADGLQGWFRSTISSTVTITPSAAVPDASLSEYRMALGQSDGWDTASTESTPAAPAFTLERAPGATALGLEVSSLDRAGNVSAPAVLWLRPDGAAPTASFALAPGAPRFQTATSFTVAWTEADTSDGTAAGSGTVRHSLQRERGRMVTRGSCTGVVFAPDGVARPASSPASESGLLTGYCYRWQLTLDDAVGNTSSAVSGVLAIDLAPPTGTLAVTVPGAVTGTTLRAFSPNGDGQADLLTVSWTATRSVSGTFIVSNASGIAVRRTLTAATSGTLTWDGRTDAGIAAPDGGYDLRLELADSVGRRLTLASTAIVDRAAGSLRAPTLWYPQDADRLTPTGTVTFTLASPARVTLDVLDARGRIVRTAFTGVDRAAGPATWAWDGRDAAGAFVPAGSYRARLRATTSHSTSALLATTVLSPFVVEAPAGGLRAGVDATVRITSAETLAAAPKVTITQNGVVVATRTATLVSTRVYSVSVRLPAVGTGTFKVVATDKDRGTNTGYTTLAVGS